MFGLEDALAHFSERVAVPVHRIDDLGKDLTHAEADEGQPDERGREVVLLFVDHGESCEEHVQIRVCDGDESADCLHDRREEQHL